MDITEFRAEMNKKKPPSERVVLALPPSTFCVDVPEIINEWNPLLGRMECMVITEDGRKIPVDAYCWSDD